MWDTGVMNIIFAIRPVQSYSKVIALQILFLIDKKIYQYDKLSKLESYFAQIYNQSFLFLYSNSYNI